MKIATWNVNSIVARLPHVIRWLEAVQPAVLCMQETKCTDDKFPFDEFSRIGYCASVFGQQSYNGVAIVVAPEDRDVHNPQLWQERIMCSQAERVALDEIKRWGFTDAFRLHHEEGGQFSWWDYRAGAFRRNMGLRIDHMWVTKPLVARSQNTWIDIEPRTWERPSDHAPVVAEFE